MREQIHTRILADPEFPQLSEAFNLPVMQKIFQNNLFELAEENENHHVIRHCQITEQRYKPGRSCVIGYRLTIENIKTGTTREQLLSARLCKPQRGLAEYNRAKSMELARANHVKPLIYVPQLEMVAWSFPNDGKLTELPTLFDLSLVSKFFSRRPEILEEIRSVDPDKIRMFIEHYLPERSCMLRYQLETADSLSSEVKQISIFGKMYRDDIGAGVYQIMSELYGQSEAMTTAKPVYYDPEIKTLWQMNVAGQAFDWEQIDSTRCVNDMQRIALATAGFHGATISTPNQFEFDDIQTLLMQSCDYVGQCYPELADRVRYIVHSLLTQSGGIDFRDVPPTPIHRDLKVGNFLIDGQKVSLIDMDTVCLGDPLSDIASFIANFHIKAFQNRVNESRSQDLIDNFVRVYCERVRWKISYRRLYWYVSASLVYEVIRRSIRQWNLNWLKYIVQCIDLSEEYCFRKSSRLKQTVEGGRID